MENIAIDTVYTVHCLDEKNKKELVLCVQEVLSIIRICLQYKTGQDFLDIQYQ